MEAWREATYGRAIPHASSAAMKGMPASQRCSGGKRFIPGFGDSGYKEDQALSDLVPLQPSAKRGTSLSYDSLESQPRCP